MMRTRTTIAVLAALAISVAHAETPSSVLETLPAEVQKHVEEIRASCREYLKNDNDGRPEIASGDDGLVQFTLSGVPAVMVSDGWLCGGRQCIKGANCSTAGYKMAIYVRSGSTWKIGHEDGVPSFDIFLSLDSGGDAPAFRAMVLGIPGDSKNCPKRQRDILMRTYGSTAFKRECDVIVRWNGTKFTYEALVP
jgi:hypothetical protein